MEQVRKKYSQQQTGEKENEREWKFVKVRYRWVFQFFLLRFHGKNVYHLACNPPRHRRSHRFRRAVVFCHCRSGWIWFSYNLCICKQWAGFNCGWRNGKQKREARKEMKEAENRVGEDGNDWKSSRWNLNFPPSFVATTSTFFLIFIIIFHAHHAIVTSHDGMSALLRGKLRPLRAFELKLSGILRLDNDVVTLERQHKNPW